MDRARDLRRGRFREGGIACGIGLLLVAQTAFALDTSPSGQPHFQPDDSTCGTGENHSVQAGYGVAISRCGASFVAWANQSEAHIDLGLALGWLSEFSSAGKVRALANLRNATIGPEDVGYTPEGLSVQIPLSAVVTSGTGQWNASDAMSGGGEEEITPGEHVLGTSTMTVSFLLGLNGSSTPKVQLGLSLSEWPWNSSADSLGLEVDTNASTGSELSYDASTLELSQSSNSGAANAILELNSSATSQSGGFGAPLSTAIDTEVFSMGGPQNFAVTLLSFLGQPGGYLDLSYVSSIAFPRPSVGPSVPVPPLSTGGWAAVIGVLVAAVVLVVVGVRARRKPLEEELGDLEAGSMTRRPAATPLFAGYSLRRPPKVDDTRSSQRSSNDSANAP